MKKNKVPVTQKLIVIMSAIMLVANGLLAYVIQGVMSSTLTETEHKYISEIVKNITVTSEQTVREYITVCEVLSKSHSVIEILLDSDENSPMEDHDLAQDVAEELRSIMAYSEGTIMAMFLLDIETDGIFLYTGEGLEDFSFKERPYYEAVHTKTFVVTEPYLDVLTGGLVVSVGSPVLYEGEVLGMVTLDLPIDFLSHLVMDSSYGSTGRSLVLDNQNIILAYADPSYINKHYEALNITGAALENELKSPTGELVSYEIDGEQRLGMVSHMEELDWKVLTGMNYSEFDQISSTIVLLLAISMLFTLLVCSLIISGKLSKTISQLNNVDSLTGLANRSGYSDKVSAIMEKEPQTMGVISVNMNGLKKINDDYGHDMGDKYIKTTALRLQEQLGFDIFRMGGDEFIGLVPDMEEDVFEGQVLALMKLMRKEKNYDFAMGHAWTKEKIDLTKLTFEADNSMYINKQEFYAKGDTQVVNIHDTVLIDLLKILAEDEFMVYLQPQVRLKDVSLHGAEALIRRFDKTNQKMVFPDQFISLYEQKSVIRHVDFFVIEEVCSLLSKWAKLGKAIPISVNLSRVTLQEYGVVENIVEICDKYQVPHKYLVIEVTERVGLVENNVASSLVSSFKEQGFHISLDDFGCAYSNIVTLAQIEVDEVKIDKSLVDDLTTSKKNLILVKNVLSMCHELEGAATLAEGIEDQEQAKLLEDLGCHLGQGYFYSRPIPISEFEEKFLFKD